MGSVRTTFAKRADFFDRIVADPTMGRAAIAVAWRLVNHINDKTQECFPSVETMADHLSVNERTVRRGIDQLVKAGWFRKEWRRRGGTQYYASYEHQLNVRTNVSTKRKPVLRTAMKKNADKTPHNMGTGSPTKPKEPIEPYAEAGTADEPPAPARAQDRRGLAAAIAHFKESESAMRKVVGEKYWSTFGSELRVLSDDGKVMVLGQPSVTLKDLTEPHLEKMATAANRERLAVRVSQQGLIQPPHPLDDRHRQKKDAKLGKGEVKIR